MEPFVRRNVAAYGGIVTTKTVTTTEALRRLRLFNEKAKELQSYSFIGKALHQDSGVKLDFDFEKKTLEAKRVGADPEARAALCLVLRFFVQKRDQIELHQIAELYQNLPVTDEDKRWVSENLALLDGFLDGPTMLAINQEPITNRAVVETFLYGDRAHANEDKRSKFDEWKEVAPIYTVLENFFEYAVCRIAKYVVWLAAMNVDAIRTLEQPVSVS
jgi:hypothetical protein